MKFPIKTPKADCWAGDTTVLLVANLTTTIEGDTGPEVIPLDLSEWVDWKAMWRPGKSSKREIELDVEITPLEGRVVVTAPAEVTRYMKSSGVWDVEAKLNDIVRTWFWGCTEWEMDVTRTNG